VQASFASTKKFATVSCDGHEWRVSFALLRHVVDL
jgi:hypothetical protein